MEAFTVPTLQKLRRRSTEDVKNCHKSSTMPGGCPKKSQVFEADPGGLERKIWYNVMMEFDCNLTFTWSSCEERKEMAHTHDGARRAKYHSLTEFWVRRRRCAIRTSAIDTRRAALGICRGIILCTSYSRTNDYVILWLRHCVQLYAEQHHA